MAEMTVRRLGYVVAFAVAMSAFAVLPSATLAQDCTGPAWANLCAPGGTTSADCNVEWMPEAEPIFNARGIRQSKVVCYEGDPRCDVDPNLVNGRCTVRVRPCLNNSDPRIPRCSPSAIASMSLLGPPRPSAVDNLNRDTFENAMGAGGFGVTVFRNATSNRGRPETIHEGVPQGTPNLCGDPVDVIVPLLSRGTRVRKGISRIRTRATAVNGRVDSDTTIIECRPSTCGDGVIQSRYEECDDGNRINGDGCDQGCQLENLAPGTPTEAPTRTPTPDPNAPTLTPTFTATPTNTPVFITRRCNFQSGTNNTGLTVAGNVTANANVTGFQDWQFFPVDENGVGEVRIPSEDMSFSCGLVQVSILITITAGTVCIRPDLEAGDGFGVIDCNGGTEIGYNSQSVADHNTNQNAVGFPQDPDCEEVFVSPDGLISRASIEPGPDWHAGVCNSSIHLSYSGNYPPNGMTLTQKLIARISTAQTTCSPNPCPANNAPLDSGAGDIALTGRLTTGQSSAVLHNRNNNQSATNYNRTFTGNPVNCGTVYSPTGNVTGMRVGVVIPFPDVAATINDALVEVRLRCQ